MKISYRLHRDSALIAAAVLAITQLITITVSVVSRVRASLLTGPVLLGMAIGLISVGLLITVLLRGRKDFLAAILLFAAMVPGVLAILGNASTAMAYVVMKNPPSGAMVLCGISASMIQIMASLTNIVFYAMLALECIKPGKISGGRFKAMLVILPAVFVVLNALAVPVQILYTAADVGFGVYLGGALKSFGTALALKLGMILAGLTFLVPVKADILDENGNPA